MTTNKDSVLIKPQKSHHGRLSVPLHVLIACLAIWLATFLVYSDLNRQQIETNRQQQQHIIQSTGDLFSARFRLFITHIHQQIHALVADNPEMFSALHDYSQLPATTQQQRLSHLQKSQIANINRLFPDAMDSRILPYTTSGTAGLNQSTIQLHNNIELLLFSTSAENSQNTIETYQVNNQWRMTFATPITVDQNTLGVLFVSFGRSLFAKYSTISNTGISGYQLTTNTGLNIYKSPGFDAGHSLQFPSPIPHTRLLLTFSTGSNIQLSEQPAYGSIFFLALTACIILLIHSCLFYFRVKQDSHALCQYATLDGAAKATSPRLHVAVLEKTLAAIDQLKVALDQQKSVIDPKPLAQNFPVANNALPRSALLEENLPVTFPDEIFRDYDIRGHAGTQLSQDLAYDIGRAIASEALALSQSVVIVGADCRLTSPRYKHSLSEGLIAGGCDVIDIGTVPSPLLYFATQHLNTGAGVIVTASHNPGTDNGFKIMLDGKSLTGPTIQRLKMRIKTSDFTKGEGTVRTLGTIETAYSNAFKNDIILAKPLKVVVDASNGAGGPLAQALLQALECEVTALYCTMDGTFPNHEPDPCNKKNLEALIATVKSEQADLGIALDGDADRVVAITDQGTMLTGDQLLMLFASDIVARNPGSHIVFDVKCSRELTKTINDLGGRPVLWKTGHSNIKQKMLETSALLGGEYTGHFCFKDRWFGFDDGIYAAARLIELLSMSHETLHEKYLKLPLSFSTHDIQIPLAPDQEKFSIIDKLAIKLQDTDADLVLIDGVRLEYPTGWGLIRASNTGQKLTARFEAESTEALSAIHAVFQSALSSIDNKLVLSIKD